MLEGTPGAGGRWGKEITTQKFNLTSRTSPQDPQFKPLKMPQTRTRVAGRPKASKVAMEIAKAAAAAAAKAKAKAEAKAALTKAKISTKPDDSEDDDD